MHDSELLSWDFRVPRVRAIGPKESWGWRAPQRHIDQRVNRVTASSGYYVIIVVFWRNSLSLCLQCSVLCVSGTSDDRGKAPAWFVHTYGNWMYFDLGRHCDLKTWCYDVLRTNCLIKNVFSKVKNCFNFYGVTSWYQSLGLRDSGAPSGVSELKPRIWE